MVTSPPRSPAMAGDATPGERADTATLPCAPGPAPAPTTCRPAGHTQPAKPCGNRPKVASGMQDPGRKRHAPRVDNPRRPTGRPLAGPAPNGADRPAPGPRPASSPLRRRDDTSPIPQPRPEEGTGTPGRNPRRTVGPLRRPPGTKPAYAGYRMFRVPGPLGNDRAGRPVALPRPAKRRACLSANTDLEPAYGKAGPRRRRLPAYAGLGGTGRTRCWPRGRPSTTWSAAESSRRNRVGRFLPPGVQYGPAIQVACVPARGRRHRGTRNA